MASTHRSSQPSQDDGPLAEDVPVTTVTIANTAGSVEELDQESREQLHQQIKRIALNHVNQLIEYRLGKNHGAFTKLSRYIAFAIAKSHRDELRHNHWTTERHQQDGTALFR